MQRRLQGLRTLVSLTMLDGTHMQSGGLGACEQGGPKRVDEISHGELVHAKETAWCRVTLCMGSYANVRKGQIMHVFIARKRERLVGWLGTLQTKGRASGGPYRRKAMAD